MSKKKTSEFTKLMIRAMVTRVQLQMKEQQESTKRSESDKQDRRRCEIR